MEPKDYIQFLEKKSIQPSIQRIKILEFLCQNRVHPTVENIYEMLIRQIPTLSRTTVYNTVRLFLEKGILIPLVIEEEEIRYDIDTTEHGHFKCMECGNVYDFPVQYEKFVPEVLNGFVIKEKHFYYKGICRNCGEKNKI